MPSVTADIGAIQSEQVGSVGQRRRRYPQGQGGLGRGQGGGGRGGQGSCGGQRQYDGRGPRR